MKKIISLSASTILFLFFSTTTSALFDGNSKINTCIQTSSTAENSGIVTMGGEKDEYLGNVKPTADGGHIMVGGTYSVIGPPSREIWVAKISATNEIEWQYIYGGDSEDLVNDILELEDGYIVVGRTHSGGAGEYDALVMKLNKDGSVNWQNTYGGLSDDIFNSAVITNDNGIIIVGGALLEGDYAAMVKLSSDGVIVWQKVIQGVGGDSVGAIKDLGNEEYLLVGRTIPNGKTVQAIWVLKIDGEGNIIWQKAYTSQYSLNSGLPIQVKDGGILFSGNTYGYINSVISHDAFLLKIDQTGDVVWQKAFGWLESDVLLTSYELEDGNLISVGYLGVKHDSVSGVDGWVLKTTAEGVPIWQKIFGDAASDNFSAINERADGTFQYWGSTDSFSSSGDYDIWSVRTDPNGDIAHCRQYEEATAVEAFIYPIDVVTTTAKMITPQGIYLQSSLLQMAIMLPAKSVCPSYSIHLPLLVNIEDPP